MKPLAPNTGPTAAMRDLRPLPRTRRLPRWLLLLLLLPLVVLAVHHRGSEPTSLSQSRLVGQRSPGALSIVLLVDESGSFRRYAAMRDSLLRELVAWAPRNLRPDDVVTVISFAGDAATRLAPVSVADLGQGAAFSDVGVDSGSTSIRPALEEAVRVAPTGMTTTLVVMTDTIVDDADQAPVATLVRELGAESTTLIRPEKAKVTDDWEQSFGWEHVIAADPGSIGASGVALAKAVAYATRQHVEVAH